MERSGRILAAVPPAAAGNPLFPIIQNRIYCFSQKLYVSLSSSFETMALHVTETRYIHFSGYASRYADLFLAVTNARDNFPHQIWLEKTGLKNLPSDYELDWYRTELFYKMGGTDSDRCINKPSDEIVKRVLELYDSIQTNKDRKLMGRLERSVSWSELYASREEELSLELFLRTLTLPQQPMKKWFTMELWTTEGTQRYDFAKVRIQENEKNEVFDVSDAIRHKTIGAIKSFLQADINARYLLKHEVPREVYQYLDELARLRNE